MQHIKGFHLMGIHTHLQKINGNVNIITKTPDRSSPYGCIQNKICVKPNQKQSMEPHGSYNA